jgi:hypothetical protein
MTQRAGAEGLDTFLQDLEPAREAPNHWPGAGRHRQEQQQQRLNLHLALGGSFAARPTTPSPESKQ